jgi:hypothetical protein
MGEHRVDVGRKQPDGKNSYKVTFEVPAEVEANQAQVCGEFNDWSATATPMTRRKDGSFAETITLEAGQRYRYRYLVDGNRWENDWTADDYVANECGGGLRRRGVIAPGRPLPAGVPGRWARRGTSSRFRIATSPTRGSPGCGAARFGHTMTSTLRRRTGTHHRRCVMPRRTPVRMRPTDAGGRT